MRNNKYRVLFTIKTIHFKISFSDFQRLQEHTVPDESEATKFLLYRKKIRGLLV